MKGFFDARSVTVVGVSDSPTNLGRAIIYNLLQYRFNGIIYAVGPKGGSFMGFKIYPSVLDVPETTDLAAILVPASVVPDVLRQCGEKGIKYVVVESAGFRELAEDRTKLEREILDILGKYQMRLIGPNCIGIINRYTGLAVPFMPVEPIAPPGHISIISQSGGVGGSLLNSFGMEKLGYSLFASIGNKLDMSECDIIDYCLADKNTRVIFLYLEGISDGRKLMEKAISSPKPIILHKSNTTKAGMNIAKSHSASLSSDDEVVSAGCRQSGIIRVKSQEEALNILKGFSLPPARGNRIGIISRSGGHAVIAADASEEFGFELVPYPQNIIEMALKHSRAGVINFQNPMDLGDVFDINLYRVLAEEVLKNDSFDALLFIHHYQGVFDVHASRELIKSFDEMSRKYDKPFAFCLFTSPKEYKVNRENVLFPIFTDPREAIKALSVARDWYRFKPIPFSKERPSGVDIVRARKVVDEASSGMMDPQRGAFLLEAYGIKLVPWALASDKDSLIASATKLGFPLVLKTASKEVIHKSDVGGVLLNLKNQKELLEAYERLSSSFGRDVLVQSMMLEDGIEWIVGGRQVPQFGPVVVTGPGGIYVEILGDRSIRVSPIDYEEADRMIEETRLSKLFKGFRGSSPKNKEPLKDIIVRLSWLLYDFPRIQEVDLNPCLVTQSLSYVLDWRIILS